MRALVIGGSRFVGLHLVLELLKGGHQVAVLNRGVTPIDLPPEVERIAADRRNRDHMAPALASRRFDAVFDIVCEQTRDAEILAEALPGMGHYVTCSGTRIYAIGDVFPIREDAPLDPNPPPDSVGAVRLVCADILTDAGKVHGYPVTVLRPHRIYGPHNYNLSWEPSFFARAEQGRPRRARLGLRLRGPRRRRPTQRRLAALRRLGAARREPNTARVELVEAQGAPLRRMVSTALTLADQAQEVADGGSPLVAQGPRA